MKEDEMGTAYSTHIGAKRNVCKVLVRKVNERKHLEVLRIYGRILKWILKKQN
jgi:hypothetical protein